MQKKIGTHCAIPICGVLLECCMRTSHGEMVKRTFHSVSSLRTIKGQRFKNGISAINGVTISRLLSSSSLLRSFGQRNEPEGDKTTSRVSDPGMVRLRLNKVQVSLEM